MKKSVKTILGTMTWGRNGQTNKKEAIEQIKTVEKWFPNNKILLDTARMYQTGETEELIGEILQENPELSKKVEVHTKAFPKISQLSKEGIRSQIEESLEALKLNFVDVYYIHMPDISVSIEEVFETTNELFKEGKFRKLGISNYPSWEVVRINALCKEKNWVIPQIYQGCYNAINTTIVPELLPALRTLNMSFYAYNPLAAGLLAGRYTSRTELETATEGRFSGEFQFVTEENKYKSMEDFRGMGEKAYRQRYSGTKNFEAIEQLSKVLQNESVTMPEASLKWLKHHSWLRSEFGDGIIIGASKQYQAEMNVKALGEENANDLSNETVNTFNSVGDLTNREAEPYFRNYGMAPGSSELYLSKFDK